MQYLVVDDAARTHHNTVHSFPSYRHRSGIVTRTRTRYFIAVGTVASCPFVSHDGARTHATRRRRASLIPLACIALKRVRHLSSSLQLIAPVLPALSASEIESKLKCSKCRMRVHEKKKKTNESIMNLVLSFVLPVADDCKVSTILK